MTSSIVDGRSGSDTVSELARSNPSLVALARAGWIAKGVVYGLVGVLAVPIALDGFDRGRGASAGAPADEEASQTGAIGAIAETSLGAVALWLVAAGLLLYVVWRLVSILLPARNTASAWATRAGYLVSVVVYSTLAWTSISFARNSSAAGQESEDARVERFTRDLMEMSGGRWLVGLIGVVLIAVGAYFVHRGVTASFTDELDGGAVGPIGHGAIVRLGQAGWVGRGVMMSLVGWFLLQAARRFDPDDAHGIDGALRDATDSTFGAVLVAVVAVGLVVYGAFCVISAPRARLTNAD